MHMSSWPSTCRINQITLIQSKMNQVTFVCYRSSPLSNLAGARMGAENKKETDIFSYLKCLKNDVGFFKIIKMPLCCSSYRRKSGKFCHDCGFCETTMPVTRRASCWIDFAIIGVDEGKPG
jgi:hypothetical protein